MKVQTPTDNLKDYYVDFDVQNIIALCLESFMSDPIVENIIDEFTRNRTRYEAFEGKIVALIKDILDAK